jgi:ribosomal protein S27AE
MQDFEGMVMNKKQHKAWVKCAERIWKTTAKAPLGTLAGGCPNCGHLCSFDDKKFSCGRCGWNWKKEKI